MQLGRTASMSFLSVLFSLALLLCQSCALIGGGGENIRHAQGYSVKAPPRWKAIDHGEGDHAYKLASGNVITLTSSCNRDTHVSLELMTRHLLLGERGTVIEKRERMVVDGVTGLFSAVQTTLESNTFYLDLFVLPKQGCIFDFSLVSPRPIPSNETDEFLTFVKSFRYGKS